LFAVKQRKHSALHMRKRLRVRRHARARRAAQSRLVTAHST
jgi:hypothetical protein